MSKRHDPTPFQRDTILRWIKLGYDPRAAADRAGIDSALVFDWIARGERDVTGPCRDLVDAIENVEHAHRQNVS